MKKRVIILLIPLAIVFFITGCFGPKIDIDDSSYEFIKYISFDEYNPDETMIIDSEYINSLKQDKGKKEFADWILREIKYAIDKNNQLYSYQIITDEKDNMTLECMPMDIMGIKEIFLVKDNLYIWTNDGIVYQKVDGQFNQILSNISEVILHKYEDDYDSTISQGYNASAITNDSSLYIWGANGNGQIGNGECSYNEVFYEYSDKFYDPYLTLENVKEYKIETKEENYYKCAAITLEDELYVWGALPRIKESVTINIGGGDTVEKQIEKVHPDQNGYSPIKKLENVKSFGFQEDGILATTNDGEQILINEVSNMPDDQEVEANYRNTKSLQNRWEPVFDSVMVNLQGNYDGDEVQRIYGTIINNMDITWNNCRLIFMLYDKNGQYIDQISIVIGNTDIGEKREFSTDTSDSLFMYNAAEFELIEVGPNVVY